MCHRPATASTPKGHGVITVKLKPGEEPIEQDWDKSLRGCMSCTLTTLTVRVKEERGTSGHKLVKLSQCTMG